MIVSGICYTSIHMSSGLLTFLEMRTGSHTRFRQRKDQLLKPLLLLLQRLGIQADHITIAGFIIGLLGIPVLWYSYGWFVAIELLSAACDGLDGPLARLSGKPSPAGAQLDFSADMTIGVTMCAALIVWTQQPMLVLCLNSYGMLLGLNWLMGSPLKVAPGRMLMVLASLLMLPILGIILAGLYSIYMLCQLLRSLDKI